MILDLSEVAREICKNSHLTYLDKVGEGTFKETFHVMQADGLSEALKVFRNGYSNERSTREIEAMLRCDHPNIVKIHNVSTIDCADGRYLFIIEEYLRGGTLTERLKKSLLSPNDVFIVGKTLISAVDHISSHGFVHRDFKPDNIMFREDRVTPVVVDFGLVRDLGKESLTKTWFLQGPGSPYFSAPEQLNNEKALIDWRTDQFALGILLSICAFGSHPYARQSDKQIDIITRVASREQPSSEFVIRARENKLAALIYMVAPWPVERFRTPDLLAVNWNTNCEKVN